MSSGWAGYEYEIGQKVRVEHEEGEWEVFDAFLCKTKKGDWFPVYMLVDPRGIRSTVAYGEGELSQP